MLMKFEKVLHLMAYTVVPVNKKNLVDFFIKSSFSSKPKIQGFYYS